MSDIMMNTMVVVIMYGSNIVDDYNDYDGCIVFLFYSIVSSAIG